MDLATALNRYARAIALHVPRRGGRWIDRMPLTDQRMRELQVLAEPHTDARDRILAGAFGQTRTPGWPYPNWWPRQFKFWRARQFKCWQIVLTTRGLLAISVSSFETLIPAGEETFFPWADVWYLELLGDHLSHSLYVATMDDTQVYVLAPGPWAHDDLASLREAVKRRVISRRVHLSGW